MIKEKKATEIPNKKGRKKIGRAVATTPQMAETYRPAYSFVSPGSILRSNSIPVYLTEDDSEIRGKVEKYGFDPRTFDRALFRMYKKERKKAWTVFYFMKTNPDFYQKEVDSMQERSRKLFIAMQTIEAELLKAQGEERLKLQKKMLELNRQFHELIENNRLYPIALTMRNPWMIAFLKLSDLKYRDKITQAQAIEFCHHITISATIDKKTGNKPKIQNVEAYPLYTEYRDVLPHRVGSSYSIHTYSSKGKEIYMEWAESHEISSLSQR